MFPTPSALPNPNSSGASSGSLQVGSGAAASLSECNKDRQIPKSTKACSEQKTLSLRKCSIDIFCKTLEFAIKSKGGILVKKDEYKSTFEVPKDFYLDRSSLPLYMKYDFLRDVILEPRLLNMIIENNLIPIMLTESVQHNHIILEFMTVKEDIFTHTVKNKSIPHDLVQMRMSLDPDACAKKDNSMLMVNRGELGFTDGNPRYLYTYGLGPCISAGLTHENNHSHLEA